MAKLNRRTLLSSAATGAAAAGLLNVPGAAAAAGSCAPEPSYEVPPSTLPTDPADNPIGHIGVLMMENRSYDTYLGWLEGGRGFLELGLDLSYTDPDSGMTARPRHWAPEYRRIGHPDPDHGWNGGRAQLRDGFLAGRNDEYALAYYLPEDIPIYARVLRQFTTFDDYYCAVLGPTYPNRHYQHGADAGGVKSNEFPGPGTAYPDGYSWTTLWDRLAGAGISYRYYFSDLPFIAMYGPRHADHAFPISQFFVDAATGALPQVYFIDPSFLPPFQTDDHPGSSDMRASQAFVNNIVHALVNAPQWSSSALFVNYDEWGGFFDHRTPPRVPDDRASEDLAEDWGQLGFRVPCLAVSPWSRKGHIHHDGPFEHSSILAFISYRFELDSWNARVAGAKNIGHCFAYDEEPRIHLPGMDYVETPTVFESFTPGMAEEDRFRATYEADYGPTIFQRFAHSGVLERFGFRLHEPTRDELFGFGDRILPAIHAAGGVPPPGVDVSGVG